MLFELQKTHRHKRPNLRHASKILRRLLALIFHLAPALPGFMKLLNLPALAVVIRRLLRLLQGLRWFTGVQTPAQRFNIFRRIHTDRNYKVRVSTSPVREHRVGVFPRYPTIRDPELALRARYRAHEINTIRISGTRTRFGTGCSVA